MVTVANRSTLVAKITSALRPVSLTSIPSTRGKTLGSWLSILMVITTPVGAGMGMNVIRLGSSCHANADEVGRFLWRQVLGPACGVA
jgi:hypothetical protein